jgi:hypothetical protein
MPFFPITFSIPKEKVLDKTTVFLKKKWLSSIVPNSLGHKGYFYETEEEYYNEYKDSYFAITCKKAGYDCLRHYEILANGCLPLFNNDNDLNNCPELTMFNFPKEIMKRIKTIYDKHAEHSSFHINELKILRYNCLEYTLKHLTTEATVSYIFKCMNFTVTPNTTVLFLSGETSIDYLRCLTLHGMKKILKKNCHDYPKIQHLYTSDTQTPDQLYGKGFTCTKLLEDTEYRNDQFDISILEDIMQHKYTFVLYGSFHRGLPFHDIVKQYYKPNELIYLCGEDFNGYCHDNINNISHDIHYCELKESNCYNESYCFIREMNSFTFNI